MRFYRQVEFWVIVAAVAGTAVGYLALGPRVPFWPGLLLRVLYLPVLGAGFYYGLRGGLVAGTAAGLVVAARVLSGPQAAAAFAAGTWVELPLLLAVGIAAGALADRRRRAERIRRRAERQRTLGQMGDGIARELRRPLGLVQRSARTLAGSGDSRTVELAGQVATETDRAEQMVDALLRYARPAQLHFGRGRLSEVLEDCLERLAPAARSRRIEFTRHWPDPEPEIYIDPGQLGQALCGLLENALEASVEGGRVIVRVERAGRRMRVTVRDFGPGIPADKLARVFEPFFTTRERGIGLGLAAARRIVAEHDGRLWLENAEPRGVIATVEIPGSLG